MCPRSAEALVVVSPGTDVAPTGTSDPGWNNVTVAGGRNFIYLGDGWAISARHVGPQITDAANLQALQFSTGSFNLIKNQNFIVDNPASLTLGGATVAHPLPPDPYESDLRLVRLDTDPGLPSIFDANPKFTIPSQPPAVVSQVMVVGSGPSRNSGETNWNSSWQTVPPNAGPVAFTGFTASNQPQDIIKRWGTNNLVNANSVSNILNQVLSPTTGVVALVTPDGYTRDVASLVASFDQNVGSPSYESQVVPGDSGSGVFYKNGNQWNLVGIADAQFIYTNQPGLTAMYGDLTTYIDLAYYHDQIFNIINAHKNYSISGDINLDGNLCGDGSPACGSSDVAA
ncbi:MAG TPA: hypothetical protein VGM76_08850, partial [Lacipirellulaceae bacterium]